MGNLNTLKLTGCLREFGERIGSREGDFKWKFRVRCDRSKDGK